MLGNFGFNVERFLRNAIFKDLLFIIICTYSRDEHVLVKCKWDLRIAFEIKTCFAAQTLDPENPEMVIQRCAPIPQPSA